MRVTYQAHNSDKVNHNGDDDKATLIFTTGLHSDQLRSAPDQTRSK